MNRRQFILSAMAAAPVAAFFGRSALAEPQVIETDWLDLKPSDMIAYIDPTESPFYQMTRVKRKTVKHEWVTQELLPPSGSGY